MENIEDDNSYISGCKYIDFVNGEECINFIAAPKSKDFENFLKIIKRIAKNQIKKIPLFKNDDYYKPRALEINKEFVPPTPNISKKVEKQLIKDLEYNLSKIYNKEFKINKGNYDEVYKMLTTENIIYYKIYSSAMRYIFDCLMNFLKEKYYELIYIQKVDLTSVCSFFLLCFQKK